MLVDIHIDKYDLRFLGGRFESSGTKNGEPVFVKVNDKNLVVWKTLSLRWALSGKTSCLNNHGRAFLQSEITIKPLVDATGWRLSYAGMEHETVDVTVSVSKDNAIIPPAVAETGHVVVFGALRPYTWLNGVYKVSAPLNHRVSFTKFTHARQLVLYYNQHCSWAITADHVARTGGAMARDLVIFGPPGSSTPLGNKKLCEVLHTQKQMVVSVVKRSFFVGFAETRGVFVKMPLSIKSNNDYRHVWGITKYQIDAVFCVMCLKNRFQMESISAVLPLELWFLILSMIPMAVLGRDPKVQQSVHVQQQLAIAKFQREIVRLTNMKNDLCSKVEELSNRLLKK